MKKVKFIQHLFDLHFLWSYDRTRADQLSDSTIVEHTLLYGDVSELKTLFQLFDKNFIQEVWEEQLVPHQRYHKINTYLGTFFFRIPNLQEFLKARTVEYPRLERLRLLAAGD